MRRTLRLFPLSASGSLLILSLACSRESRRVELAVYAATSTRDALQSLEAAYERDHGVDLVFNFGSSADLSKQIRAAAKADVFLSADDLEMDMVEDANLLISGTRRPLLSNQLAVIEPADAPSIFRTPFEPVQLAGSRVRLLSLADVQTVPAGRYARAWLEQAGVWEKVSDRILPGVDARAALAAVESGGTQAGVVYRTDAARSKKARIVFVVPIDQGPRISYPVAAVSRRSSEQESRAFVDFLASPSARSVFAAFGFAILDG